MIDPYRMVVVNIVGSILLITGLLIYRFVYPKRPLNLFYVLLLISILPVISTLRSGTYESGDLTIHTIFLQSFFENIKDGILIPQWNGGLCGGYGCPVFMFLYLIPYYIGSFFHVLGFSFLDSMKLFLATSYILSGITMYIFMRSEFQKTPAFVAALLYLFAPIHFIEMHFRISVGTQAAFIFIPLAFLFAKKSLEGKSIYIILGAVNYLFLILSQANAAFAVSIATLLYVFFIKKSLKAMLYPVLSFILGLGISAYYMLPAIFESKYSWIVFGINAVGDFKPFFEYIYSPSRFGLLFQGNNGETRFIIGYTQLFIVLYSIYALLKNKFEKKQRRMVMFLLVFFFICFTLMQSFTKFIWDNVFFLRTFQFPWRLLVPIAFITAYLGAITVKKWKNTTILVLVVLTILLTILNWGNRKMVPMDPEAYNKHVSIYLEYYEANNPIYEQRVTEKIGRLNELISPRPSSHLQLLEGEAEVKEISRTQISHEYIVYAKNKVKLSENTHYFLGWKVYVDQQEIPINVTDKKHFGTLTFTLPEGIYHVKAVFEDTPVRIIGKYISAFTIIVIFLIFFISLKNKKFRIWKNSQKKIS